MRSVDGIRAAQKDARVERTALVTGGLSWLGKASATKLASEGARVITLDIADGADLVADITDAAAVHEAIENAGPMSSAAPGVWPVNDAMPQPVGSPLWWAGASFARCVYEAW